MAKPVFISYATDDTQVAEQIRDGLEAAGIPCWMAPRDIVPGKEYAEQILDAIEGCGVMVLVVSETSNVSRFVRSEVERAVSKNKIVIPVRIHDVTLSRSLEFFVSSAQWIDALDDVNSAMPVLNSAIRQHIPEQASPVAKPDEGAQGQRPLHNLPSPATPFLGRRREIDDVLTKLQDPACRLLALVGQGGMGKTRLAIEVARRAYEQEDETPDGVFFAPLETLSRPDQIGAAIASSLGLPVEGADPFGLALRYMAGKRLLLVLDNFEHLLQGAGLVSEILAQCTAVKVLVTSRETLNLQEEWFFPVGGLDMPDLPKETEEEVRRSAAVQLFLQNAQRARANRDFTAELPCIVRVCRTVEGAPLALELAAHWVRTLSCEQIVSQLQSNLDLLATPVRNVPERHRSMRAVFDYSWQLAGQRKRSLLCQLAVFVGGFDWPAFQAVTQGSLADLAELVDTSWVQAGQEGRYGLHPLVHTYLAEKLEREVEALRGENPDEVRHRHSRYYAQVANECVTAVLRSEIVNLVAGWRHAVQQLDTASLRLYVEPIAFSPTEWPLPVAEFDALIAQAADVVHRRRLQTPQLDSAREYAALEVMLLSSRGHLMRRAGQAKEAEAFLEQALSVLDSVGHQPGASRLRIAVLNLFGTLRINQGRYAEAGTLLGEAQEIADRLAEPWGQFRSTHSLSMRADEIGAYDMASALNRNIIEQAPTHPTQPRMKLLRWVAHARLMSVAVKQGRLDVARQLLAPVRDGLESVSHFQQLETGLREARYELLRGNTGEAYSVCQSILPAARTYGYSMVEAQALNTLGQTNLALGQVAEAEAAFHKARNVAEGQFFQLSVEALVGLGAAAVLQGRHQAGEERLRQVFVDAWPTGLLPEVLEALIWLAEVQVRTGDPMTARRRLQVAVAHPSTVYLARVHAQDLLEGLGESMVPDEVSDPQAALTEIVTHILAGNGQDATEER